MIDLAKRISLLAVVVFAFPGCSGEGPRPAGMPKLYPCTITITQEGTPLDAALISLIADDPELSKWASGGSTDNNGKCDLYLRGKFRGVPAGKFKVTVSKLETEESKLGNAPPEGASSDEVDRWWNQREREKLKAFQRVAEKYTLPQTTDLEIEVLTKPNSFTLDVGASVNITILPD